MRATRSAFESTPSCDSEPVPVQILHVALASGETLFVDRDPELLRDSVDVVDVQVDQAVRRRVALVFRQIEPDVSTRDQDEPWKARLELMLPLLPEPDAPVPVDGATGVLHTENRDDLFVHLARG